MDRKIFVVGPQTEYASWMQGDLVDSVAEADLVVFTGGEDVSPWIYGQHPHPLTRSNPHRDQQEIGAFKDAFEQGKHMIGICRGSQFLCAMAGGELVQHQDNPTLYHPIETYDGKTISVISTHHQAQYPWNLGVDEFKVLAWSKGVSRYHEGQFPGEELVVGTVPGDKEVEIVYYPAWKSLAIQTHPEMMLSKAKYNTAVHESMLWLRVLLNAHLNNLL